MVDAQYADKVVAITDCLVPFPNIPASISMVDVDYVCVVDAIGNPAKIATGVGGAFIVSTISLGKIMEERGIQMGLGLGGITTPMCDLLEKGLIRTLVDTHFNCNVVVGIIEGRDGTIMDVVREIKEYQFD